jgi:hypothetical protein
VGYGCSQATARTEVAYQPGLRAEPRIAGLDCDPSRDGSGQKVGTHAKQIRKEAWRGARPACYSPGAGTTPSSVVLEMYGFGYERGSDACSIDWQTSDDHAEKQAGYRKRRDERLALTAADSLAAESVSRPNDGGGLN